MTILMAIESSCDETACAVVKDGCEILSSIVSSQINVHTLYGGVVPEVAAFMLKIFRPASARHCSRRR